jgi:hypothetical protein
MNSIIDSATSDPRETPRTRFEYRAYVVGNEGHFVGCTEMICRDDDEAIAKAKRLVSDSDIELWNRNRFIILLVH